jgi:hypothetical protein
MHLEKGIMCTKKGKGTIWFDLPTTIRDTPSGP